MSNSDLYDTDILLWSERQADLLRRHAARERVNDASIDWPNIAEEIEDVPHLRAEARGHRDDARRRFSPSVAQRIDVAKLYREALRRLPDTMDGTQPLPVSRVCPVTLAELLAEPGE